MKKRSRMQKQMRETVSVSPTLPVIGIDVGEGEPVLHCRLGGGSLMKAAFATRRVPSKNISAGSRGGSRWRPARSRPGSAGS